MDICRAALKEKGKSLLLWLFNSMVDKFKNIISKLKKWLPVLDKYPLLFYCLIPLLIAVFIAARYGIKYIVNGAAALTSTFVVESSGFAISEKTIVLIIAAVFILLRIVIKIISQNKKKLTNNN